MQAYNTPLRHVRAPGTPVRGSGHELSPFRAPGRTDGSQAESERLFLNLQLSLNKLSAANSLFQDPGTGGTATQWIYSSPTKTDSSGDAGERSTLLQALGVQNERLLAMEKTIRRHEAALDQLACASATPVSTAAGVAINFEPVTPAKAATPQADEVPGHVQFSLPPRPREHEQAEPAVTASTPGRLRSVRSAIDRATALLPPM